MDTPNLAQSSPANAQKSSARYYTIMIFLGVSVVTTVTSLVIPRVITWWYDSPAPTPVTAACVPAIDWAIRMLQTAQLIAVPVGALVGLLVAIRFRKKPQLNPLNTR